MIIDEYDEVDNEEVTRSKNDADKKLENDKNAKDDDSDNEN